MPLARPKARSKSRSICSVSATRSARVRQAADIALPNSYDSVAVLLPVLWLALLLSCGLPRCCPVCLSYLLFCCGTCLLCVATVPNRTEGSRKNSSSSGVVSRPQDFIAMRKPAKAGNYFVVFLGVEH